MERIVQSSNNLWKSSPFPSCKHWNRLFSKSFPFVHPSTYYSATFHWCELLLCLTLQTVLVFVYNCKAADGTWTQCLFGRSVSMPSTQSPSGSCCGLSESKRLLLVNYLVCALSFQTDVTQQATVILAAPGIIAYQKPCDRCQPVRFPITLTSPHDWSQEKGSNLLPVLFCSMA